jgi:hypothetical protein
MTRQQQIASAAKESYEKYAADLAGEGVDCSAHSWAYMYQFVQGAQWADKTMIDKACEAFCKCECSNVGRCNAEAKCPMLFEFKQAILCQQ